MKIGMKFPMLLAALAFGCGGGGTRSTFSVAGADASSIDGGPTNSAIPPGGADAEADARAGGTAIVLASSQDSPFAITLDATSVYWTHLGPLGGGKTAIRFPGSVMKMPIAGGTPTTLAAGQVGPVCIAVDATSVYWCDQGMCPSDGGACNGAGMKVPLGGGAAVTLASVLRPDGIAVDSTNIYWTDQGSTAEPYADSTAGTVMQMPLDGGSAVTLASGQNWPSAIAVDGTNVYWTKSGGVDGTNGAVLTVPIGGGAVTALASNQILPLALGLRDETVYWANGCEDAARLGSIRKVPKGGGPAVVLASGGVPGALAVGVRAAYWTDDSYGIDGVFAVPLLGGVAASLPSGQNLAEGIAVDATNIYWTTYEGAVKTLSIE